MNDPVLLPFDQHIIVSALRHCREVHSYFTTKTIEWIMKHWDDLDYRTQAQLISDAQVDLQLRDKLTAEERKDLIATQGEWEHYLDFLESKMNH